MFRKLLYIILLLSLLTNCRNDLELLAPYQDIPVVYCILNQNDSIHYLRLGKSFAGPKNAYEMAMEADSIYYKQADIVLERWKDDEFVSSMDMTLTDSIRKDSGIFAYHKPLLYSTMGQLDGSSEYRIKIHIAETGKEITATTSLVDGIRIIKPFFTRPSINFSAYNNYLEVEWVSSPNARIYFLQFRFNYLEVFGRDTIHKEQIWSIAHFSSLHAKGGERMETRVNHKSFYAFLALKIPPPENGIRRIAEKKAFDIIFTVGGEELYTYMEVYDPDHNMMTERPIYSNITNGIGIFSARYQQEIKGKALTFPSIDSIAHGQFTSHLGFVDSTDDYYNR